MLEVILDHWRKRTFSASKKIKRNKLYVIHQEVEPKKRVFRRSAQSGFLPKLENVPKIYEVFSQLPLELNNTLSRNTLGSSLSDGISKCKIFDINACRVSESPK